MDVLLKGFVEILQLFAHLLTLWGLPELLPGLADLGSLLSFSEIVEGLVIFTSPVRLLELLELSIDVVGLSLDDVKSLVVNMDAVVGFLDVLIKGLEEFVDFFIKLLSLGRLGESLVKLTEVLGLFSLTQLLNCMSEVLDWLRVSDLSPLGLNIIDLFLDILDAIIIDFDSKVVGQEFFWKIGHFDVLSEGVIKLLKLSLKSLPFLGFLHSLNIMADALSLLVRYCLFPCIIVFFTPLRLSELFKLIVNILRFVVDDLESIVVNFDASFSLVDVSFQSMSEFSPFLHELFTLLSLKVLVVKLSDLLSFIRVSPSPNTSLDSFTCFAVSNSLGSTSNISKLLFDFLFTLGSYFKCVHGLGILPFLGNVSNLDVLLDGVLKLFDLCAKSVTSVRVLEIMEVLSNLVSFLSLESCLPSLIVLLGPSALEESVVSISDIFDLIRELIQLLVGEVDMALS